MSRAEETGIGVVPATSVSRAPSEVRWCCCHVDCHRGPWVQGLAGLTRVLACGEGLG